MGFGGVVMSYWGWDIYSKAYRPGVDGEILYLIAKMAIHWGEGGEVGSQARVLGEQRDKVLRWVNDHYDGGCEVG